jgi:hypothetical protein
MTLSDIMAKTGDPTMAANAESAQKGKPPPWQIEHLLREIEENNLDRELFNAQKQLWEKNPKFYGDPASESRKSFGRFIANSVKRRTWQQYASLLMEHNVDMSETTEAALALEIEGEEVGHHEALEAYRRILLWTELANGISVQQRSNH